MIPLPIFYDHWVNTITPGKKHPPVFFLLVKKIKKFYFFAEELETTTVGFSDMPKSDDVIFINIM